LLNHIRPFPLVSEFATPLVELIAEIGDVGLEDLDRFPKCSNRFGLVNRGGHRPVWTGHGLVRRLVRDLVNNDIPASALFVGSDVVATNPQAEGVFGDTKYRSSIGQGQRY